MFNRIKMRSLTVKEATGWVIFSKKKVLGVTVHMPVALGFEREERKRVEQQLKR